MALKIQYNKTFSQELSKQLSMRERALPTLKSKETALRIEVKKAMDLVGQMKKNYEQSFKELLENGPLIREFPKLIEIKQIEDEVSNIAGVKISVLKKVDFILTPVNLLQQHAWIPTGIDLFKKMIIHKIQLKYASEQLKTLSYHRKKTTQKVNLYEKVQIPGFKEAILKIKRYLEDVENLQKAAQKIVKDRHMQMEGES